MVEGDHVPHEQTLIVVQAIAVVAGVDAFLDKSQNSQVLRLFYGKIFHPINFLK
jgi:hypothetical protein